MVNKALTRKTMIKATASGLLSLLSMPLLKKGEVNRMHQMKAIGNTPLIPLKHLPEKNSAQIMVKWEGANPTGSMKDRMALGMVEEAERQGKLKPGMRVIEMTGGSTGSSLAMVCGPKGYKTYFVTTDAVSIEKRRTMEAFGAQLEIIPSYGSGITPELVQKSLDRIKKLADEPGNWWSNQFENPANSVGYYGLGSELIKAGSVDAFVMGVGTGGCISGSATVLKDHNANTLVVAVEPAASRNLSGGAVGGHLIEGIGLGFVPKTVRIDLIDEIESVTDEEAFEITRKLARHEGLFVGPSSGANVAVSLKIAKRLGPGKNVVTLLCDTGLRYLDSDLFVSR